MPRRYPSTGHQHAEAFKRMLYQSDDGTEEEWLWNSRDGVTPFVIASRSGKPMTHVEWHRDHYVPDYVPPPGSRIFVDLTAEQAREIATTNAEVYWDDPSSEASAEYASKEELIEKLTAHYMEDLGQPHIVQISA